MVSDVFELHMVLYGFIVNETSWGYQVISDDHEIFRASRCL